VKTGRIRKTKEFQDILASGEKQRGRYIFLYWKQDKSRKDPRVGTIITKKLAPNATQRNYIKRIIYTFFDSRKQSIKPGTANIIRLVRNVRNINRTRLAKEIRKELENVVIKAGIIE